MSLANRLRWNEKMVVEIEATPGLEFVTLDEIAAQFGSISNEAGRGFIRCQGDLRLRQFMRLRTAQSIYLVVKFEIPRPRALLGDQHFRNLIEHIDQVRSLSPDMFRTFHIDAAGDSTSVMRRLKQEIASRTGLTLNEDQGDLKLRIIRARSGSGWEILIRITPRPLSTRWWRRHHLEGALNAAVASAMLYLADADQRSLVINPGCGSGTLAIERALMMPGHTTIALDNEPSMLALTAAHRAEIGERGWKIALLTADMKYLPFATGSVDCLVSDLPFGQRVGTHASNQNLYPVVLQEAGRIASKAGLFVLITHEVRLMERLLAQQERWICRKQIMITLRGLHPRIYVLERA